MIRRPKFFVLGRKILNKSTTRQDRTNYHMINFNVIKNQQIPIEHSSHTTRSTHTKKPTSMKNFLIIRPHLLGFRLWVKILWCRKKKLFSVSLLTTFMFVCVCLTGDISKEGRLLLLLFKSWRKPTKTPQDTKAMKE